MSKAKAKEAIDVASARDIRGNILGGVGYGLPPEHTRFKKGKSGNPAGRPRKGSHPTQLSTTNAILLAESERLITIVENGEKREITAMEAAVKSLIRTAVRGNSYALGHLFTHIEKAQRERAVSIEAENVLATNYVAVCHAEIRSAQESGRPEPEFYPHPDDVVIVPGQPFQVFGPTTKDEAVVYDNAVKTRDLFIMQATLAPLPRDSEVSVELILAISINAALPARMRLAEDAWFLLDWRSRRTPKRQLEKQIQAGWRDLGIDAPRGFVFPLLERELFQRRFAQIRENAAARL